MLKPSRLSQVAMRLAGIEFAIYISSVHAQLTRNRILAKRDCAYAFTINSNRKPLGCMSCRPLRDERLDPHTLGYCGEACRTNQFRLGLGLDCD